MSLITAPPTPLPFLALEVSQGTADLSPSGCHLGQGEAIVTKGPNCMFEMKLFNWSLQKYVQECIINLRFGVIVLN